MKFKKKNTKIKCKKDLKLQLKIKEIDTIFLIVKSVKFNYNK